MRKINELVEIINNKGFKAELKTVEKNGKKLEAIVFNMGMVNPTIYPTKYKEFNTLSAEEFADKIIEMVKEQPLPSIDIDNISNWEYVKDFVYAEVVNTESLNSDDAYMPLLNMAIRFKVYVDMDNNDGNRASFIVKKSMIDEWNININTLLEVSKENNLFPPIVRNMMDVLSEFDAIPGEIPNPGDMPPMYVITNKEFVGGASVLINDTFLNEVMEKCNLNKVIIIPSSIHELIIPPQGEGMDPDPETLRDMIVSVNETLLPEEVLCNDPLVYTKENGLQIYA